MATDPVCGMYVDERAAELTLVVENRTYYFCSHACRASFQAPEASARRLARRLVLAWPLAVLATLLTYAPGPSVDVWVAALAATIVQFYCGLDFYVGTVDAVRSRMGNMDVLIAVGTTAAYGYSIAALVVPGSVSPAYFFDASTLVIALILSGNLLEQRTRARAGAATRDLERLLPREVLRVDPNGIHRVPREAIAIGDRVRVLPGESLPVDGIVREGRSEVDESLLTGESSLVAKGPGDRAVAGARNGAGALDIEALSVGPDTFVAQIGRLLSDAESARIPMRRTADRIAAIFVPSVLALAIAAGLGWGLVGGASATTALLIFVTVVIIACPCAFGIATPAAILVGTGRAAEEGILFRGGDAIERTARTSLVVADKTGTLTSAEVSLEGVTTLGGRSTSEVLAIAAGLEAHSEHLLARAVLRAASDGGIVPTPLRDVRAEPGSGVVGLSEGGRRVELRGGAAAIRSGVELSELAAAIQSAESNGATWSILLDEERPTALLTFAAPLGPGVAEGLRMLGEMAVPVEMLTGDRSAVAERVARQLGIHVVRASATPSEKVGYVAQRHVAGESVAFVGDGINDAAALAAADVGIAIGTGADVARDAGQVLLVRPDFRGIPRAIFLSRAIVRKVRGNLAWAIGYNAVLLPIAAGALIPALGFGVYSVLPVAAAAAMALSSTTVLANSLSLRGAPADLRRATSHPAVPSTST